MHRFEWIYEAVAQDAYLPLSRSLNISDHLAEMLYKRHITDYETARDFFCPSFDKLHSPFLLKDMQKAIDRIVEAAHRRQKILIYGDYDVDGVTSTAALFSFLTRLVGVREEDISFYIPNRLTEGYGLQEHGIKYILENKPNLLVTVDCGATSVDHIKELTDRGIDCIVCDHHFPKEKLPPAYAILNPKQADCPYPYKELSACGLVFKLIQGLSEHLRIPRESIVPFLDLVALSTAADIVPLTGENRTLMRAGLSELEKENRASIRNVKKALRLKEYSVRDIVFGIAPLLNAAGRMEHAKKAAHLLLSEEEGDIFDLADRLKRLNDKRKDMQEEALEEAVKIYQSQPSPFSIVVFLSRKEYKGILGIVASKLKEMFYKPAIVFTEEEGYCVGSARGIDEVDLYSVLQDCNEHIHSFGGHAHAAGMRIRSDFKERFSSAFEKAVAERLGYAIPRAKLYIDADLPLSRISPNMIKVIKRMEPFGPQNPTPLWRTKRAELIETPVLLKEKHLRCVWRQERTIIKSILFNHAAEYAPHLRKGDYYDIAFKIKSELFNEAEQIAYVIEDIKTSDG